MRLRYQNSICRILQIADAMKRRRTRLQPGASRLIGPSHRIATDHAAEVSDYLADVGAAVQRARERAGMSQDQLADQAGVSVRQIIEIEAGKNTTLATVARLCCALDLAPEDLGGRLPGGLLGPTTRAACAALGLDLRTGRWARSRRRDLSVMEQVTGQDPGPVSRRKKIPR